MAVVKVKVGDEMLISAAEGNGPVNALDVALRKDLGKYQKYIDGLKLIDYHVRILNGGTEAVTRVLIESEDETGERWTTIGVSPNIIDASFQALMDSIIYKLVQVRRAGVDSHASGLLLLRAGPRSRSCRAARRVRRRVVPMPRPRTHREFIAAAFKMSDEAVRAGDQAYGAVVVKDGRIVGFGPSRVVLKKDWTAHAEREAIREAQARLGRADLAGCVLYSEFAAVLGLRGRRPAQADDRAHVSIGARRDRSPERRGSIMIDHVSIAVRDLDAAARFYEAVLATLGYAQA